MKDLLLLIGRILVVAIFPISAYYKIIGWPGIVRPVAATGVPYPEYVAMLGTGVEMGLAILVIIGLFTRWAALGLVLYVIAATYIGHAVVWRLEGDALFRELMTQMKNLAMIGGLLMLAATGPGRLALRPGKDEAEDAAESRAAAKEKPVAT
jgi:putative oxidoreductase